MICIYLFQTVFPHFVFNLFAGLSLFLSLCCFCSLLCNCNFAASDATLPPPPVETQPLWIPFCISLSFVQNAKFEAPKHCTGYFNCRFEKRTQTKTEKILTKIKIGWKKQSSAMFVCVCVWMWVCLWMHPRQPHAACWALDSLQRSRYFIFLHYMFFMLFF